jgi:hypothetical protein
MAVTLAGSVFDEPSGDARSKGRLSRQGSVAYGSDEECVKPIEINKNAGRTNSANVAFHKD